MAIVGEGEICLCGILRGESWDALFVKYLIRHWFRSLKSRGAYKFHSLEQIRRPNYDQSDPTRSNIQEHVKNTNKILTRLTKIYQERDSRRGSIRAVDASAPILFKISLNEYNIPSLPKHLIDRYKIAWNVNTRHCWCLLQPRLQWKSISFVVFRSFQLHICWRLSNQRTLTGVYIYSWISRALNWSQ